MFFLLMFCLMTPTDDAALTGHPAAPGATGVYLTVTEDRLFMSWIEASGKKSGALKFARFDGRRWSQPQTIVDRDDLFINWTDIPKLLVLDDWMVAAWPQMLGKGTYAYGLRFARSYDGGTTWAPATWLHEDRTEDEHGFVSMVAIGQNKAGVVWLDSRAREKSGMQLRYRQIGSQNLGTEQVWDNRTCECCATDLIMTPEGPLAAYRDRSHGEVRDVALAGPNRKAALIAEDNWVIHGCPVNGPALDSLDKSVAMIWFTAMGKHRLGLASSSDGGVTFSKPLRFATDALGQVDLALVDHDEAAASWIDIRDNKQVLLVGRFRLGETPTMIGQPKMIDVVPAGRASGVPRLVRLDEQLVLAYQNPAQKGIILQVLR